MNLMNVWKSGLAMMFACTMSFALVGCEPAADPAPAETPAETEPPAEGEMPAEEPAADPAAEGSSTTGGGEETPAAE